MRLLNILALACGALAMVTPEVEPRNLVAIREDTEICPSLKNRGMDERDEDALSHLDKRVQASGLLKIPIPAGGPTDITQKLIGLTVTFVMASRWVQQGKRNVLQYYVRALRFANLNNGKVWLQAVAAQCTRVLTDSEIIKRVLSSLEVDTADVPEGVQSFNLYVDNYSDEL
ncbi:hypothetical protein E4U55_000401 [Claviceps digitariae]|nr:hypothetical protein E4U55_000401 [Claviceps digitariae]